jgi:hypothetical protein
MNASTELNPVAARKLQSLLEHEWWQRGDLDRHSMPNPEEAAIFGMFAFLNGHMHHALALFEKAGREPPPDLMLVCACHQAKTHGGIAFTAELIDAAEKAGASPLMVTMARYALADGWTTCKGEYDHPNIKVAMEQIQKIGMTASAAAMNLCYRFGMKMAKMGYISEAEQCFALAVQHPHPSWWRDLAVKFGTEAAATNMNDKTYAAAMRCFQNALEQ